MMSIDNETPSEEISEKQIEQLLDALRAEFSVSKYDGLDEKLKDLETGIGEFITKFTNADVVISSDTVAMHSVKNDVSSPDSGLVVVGFVNTREKLELCVCLNPVSFISILDATLSGPGNSKKENSPAGLTNAEFKLLLRFATRLQSAFNNIFELEGTKCNTETLEQNDLAKLAEGRELIVLGYDVTVGGSNLRISLLVPMETLEPPVRTNKSGVSDALLARKEYWAKKLSENIDDVDIPLVAQLGSAQMNLVDVAKLNKGSLLDVNLNLENVKIRDQDNLNLFQAKLNFTDKHITMFVTGSAKN